MSVFRTIISWILYVLGDLVSKIMLWTNTGFAYPLYNRLMIWSADLDREGRVWDFVDDKENSP